MTTKMTVLQLCPFSAYLEGQLAARFDRIAWFELSESDRSAWLERRASDVRGIATGGHLGCTNEFAAVLPNLGVIAINGVGFDKVDLAYARSRDIAVTTTPGVLTADVADLAVGLVISLLRDLPAADRFARSGSWLSGEKPLGRSVSGKRFGIVGLGQIGSAIATRLAPFGSVAYTDTANRGTPYEFHDSAARLAEAVDILVLACSANADTRGFIGASVFSALGRDGYLINVSRGSVVDEPALIEALASGTIAGAALDVFADEPNVPVELRQSDRVIITPHIASATAETRCAMADLVIANLAAFAEGQSLPSALDLA